MNARNTVANVKHLLGRDFTEPGVQNTERHFVTCELTAAEDGGVAAVVDYSEEKATFSMIQLQAMYLHQLKKTAENELPNPVHDVVISVPAYYTDRQRAALLSAAQIAGLNPLRLMNDSAAAALQYGITRAPELPEKDPRHVVFIDVGYSAITVSVTAFTKESAIVKATSWDRSVGGRVLDNVLVDHFAAEIMKKHKVDVKTMPKALLRLQVACERAKKLLSANTLAPLNVENLTDSIDVNSSITREDLEKYIEGPLSRIIPTIQRALEIAGITKEQVDFVELCGGTVRVPSVKANIQNFFADLGREVISTTLNFDEAVARGCAFQCAMISPLFKVRDYSIKDNVSFDINLSWKNAGDAEARCERLFKVAEPMPSTKQLSVAANEPFELEATYADLSQVPEGTRPSIARFVVQAKPNKDNENSDVKVRLRVNPSGILTLESAQAVEEVEEPAGSTPAAAAAPAEGEQPKKRKVRKTDLTTQALSLTLNEKALLELTDREMQMAANDKLISDTLESKNKVEEFVYETRDKLETSHAEFMAEDERTAFLKELRDTEDWLYGDGENSTKGVYVEKYAALLQKFNPVRERYIEAENRPAAVAAFNASVTEWITAASNAEEHITAEERQKVIDEANKKLAWLNGMLAKQNAQPKTAPVAVNAAHINAEAGLLAHFARGILNKPKPKVEPPKAETPAAESPKTDADAMDVDSTAPSAEDLD